VSLLGAPGTGMELLVATRYQVLDIRYIMWDVVVLRVAQLPKSQRQRQCTRLSKPSQRPRWRGPPGTPFALRGTPQPAVVFCFLIRLCERFGGRTQGPNWAVFFASLALAVVGTWGDQPPSGVAGGGPRATWRCPRRCGAGLCPWPGRRGRSPPLGPRGFNQR
jgi:hypothetical protein